MRDVVKDFRLRKWGTCSATESIMLAVKAKYENGTVRWEQKPPVEGLCDLIVVFETENAGKNEPVQCENITVVDQAILDIQRCYEDIPETVSLVDELIAERRREALNE